ncbi:hypothetical protein B0I35DRAFT_474237 [Stachybotrys elegans]|uniref:Ecp2 effector protein domain-containing protein n=1 Tax=Stachybotrys elegans TaxID=80388 RepID=A0A8K0T3T5_9HYPO|nr:hypothetical protein B0I35DRAFT_474237 [Stachybotrys elegans]
MIFSRFFTVTALASATLASPVQTADLEERQSTGIGAGIALIFAHMINDAWTGATPACSYSFSEGDYWHATWKNEITGLYTQACWQNETDTTPWDQGAVDAAKCLTHLHSVQANTCISVSGSTCDNGYIEGGGRLQNLQTAIWTGGDDPVSQLTPEESITIQAGIEGLNGAMVSGLAGKGPIFLAVTDETGEMATSYAAKLKARFIGEPEC